MLKSTRLVPFLTLSALSLSLLNARADIVVNFENPGVQASTVPGVTTETFDHDTLPVGDYVSFNSAIGIYSGPRQDKNFRINAPDAYGGSNQTNYFVIGNQSGTTDATLDLGQDRAYFGFYWGAGDRLNELELYNDNNLIFTYTVGDIISAINARSDSAQYYGNPNNGQNTAEPYAYLNFNATNGTVFDKVVFRNVLGTGFETDNHSVRTEPVGVPEPGAVALLVTGGISGLGLAIRRRLRK